MALTIESKYGALRIIATLIKVLAVLVLILGVIGGLGAMAGSSQMQGGNMMGGIFGGFFMLIWGLMGAIGLWAWAELINLLIDVEENTRKTHILLERERA
jgi:protein-S-isoprenylcysteine O-methyltransferase Ste14